MSWSDRGLRAFAAVLVLLVAGCGFQFSGTAALPPDLAVVRIDAVDRYSPFYRELVTVLKRSDVQLTDDAVAARTVIHIITDDTGRRLLSVTSRNVPAEYEVYYRVRFSVDANGAEAVPVEQIALTREFAFDETKVLGKSREEESIREALARDLVGLLTRRLSAVR
jgi:outer membrane lipopolysaccharide assembly protein LptE/RlpB